METTVSLAPIVFIRDDEKQIGYFNTDSCNNIEFITRHKGGENTVEFTLSSRDLENITNILTILNESLHHYLHAIPMLTVIKINECYSSLEFKREENKVVMSILTDNENTIVKWFLVNTDIEHYLNSY